ncbi:hypothetical protein PYCCODRAFT_1098773 [Trametes coccinea BRFM310]|uniref:Uncharacterized protein n=1 Tax=Trametes coccinea (strain BRFM310) TaxID=1353009 RepID=A0A1Y2I9T7_TRAC3|nr:hypothetical protein PYCCODRAFT_1098773 [Trametes coccinea BRFM310]
MPPQLESTETTLREVLVSVRRRLYEQAPVHRLPVEILVSIANAASECPTDATPIPYPKSLITLTHVCHRWRSIALEHPSRRFRENDLRNLFWSCSTAHWLPTLHGPWTTGSAAHSSIGMCALYLGTSFLDQTPDQPADSAAPADRDHRSASGSKSRSRRGTGNPKSLGRTVPSRASWKRSRAEPTGGPNKRPRTAGTMAPPPVPHSAPSASGSSHPAPAASVSASRARGTRSDPSRRVQAPLDSDHYQPNRLAIRIRFPIPMDRRWCMI